MKSEKGHEDGGLRIEDGVRRRAGEPGVGGLEAGSRWASSVTGAGFFTPSDVEVKRVIGKGLICSRFEHGIGHDSQVAWFSRVTTFFHGFFAFFHAIFMRKRGGFRGLRKNDVHFLFFHRGDAETRRSFNHGVFADGQTQMDTDGRKFGTATCRPPRRVRVSQTGSRWVKPENEQSPHPGPLPARPSRREGGDGGSYTRPSPGFGRGTTAATCVPGTMLRSGGFVASAGFPAYGDKSSSHAQVCFMNGALHRSRG
jgi:hypothetical protein